jgi:hypothetical protein
MEPVCPTTKQSLMSMVLMKEKRISRNRWSNLTPEEKQCLIAIELHKLLPF